jgi:RNA polymerase sigma-70 factor (ECF subfamily)
MAQGPAAGLAEIERLEQEGRLADYRYLPAAKADLLRRLGREDEAAQAYQSALALTENAAEREFLARRIGEVSGPAGRGGR